MSISEDEIKRGLADQLVKLADLMETCDPGDANHLGIQQRIQKNIEGIIPADVQKYPEAETPNAEYYKNVKALRLRSRRLVICKAMR